LRSLFLNNGVWFKGALHSHSTESDGWLSPECMLQAYAENGYDFVCLTDHWKVTPKPEKVPKKLLYIHGVELDGGDTGVGDFHFVGIDVKPGTFFDKNVRERKERSPEELVESIIASGGLAEIAHPSWNGVSWVDLESVADKLFALEVWNSGCDVEIGRGLSEVQWDDLLCRKHRILGLAVDDAHNYYRDSMKGWVMVMAESLNMHSIREALEKASFYSSTGPEIHDLRIDEYQISINTSPVKRIDMVSSNSSGDTVEAMEGMSLTEHVFRLPEKDVIYIRIRIRDSKGRCAWTNPIFLKEN
jgi:hypothetical protein